MYIIWHKRPIASDPASRSPEGRPTRRNSMSGILPAALLGIWLATSQFAIAQPPAIPQFPPDTTSTDAPAPAKPTMTTTKTTKTTKLMTKATPAKPPKQKSKSAPKTNNANVVKQVVLVFPVDAKGTAEQLSDVVTDVIKSRLALSGKYSGVNYLTSLPSVRRGVTEQTLSQADVLPPFTSRTKVQKLTTTAGYTLAVVSSIDQYEYSPDNGNVAIVLSIQLIDFSGATPKNYTAAEPVTTAPKSAKTATDTTAAEAAVRTLAEKLIASVLASASK